MPERPTSFGQQEIRARGVRFELFLFGFLALETRNVPVNSALRCGLRNGTTARRQRSRLTHPPPGPLVRAFARQQCGAQFFSHDAHFVVKERESA